MLLIRPQGTYFNEILFEMQKFSFKKMHLNMSSAKMAAILSRGNELKKLISVQSPFYVLCLEAISQRYIDLNCQEWCPTGLYIDKCHDMIFLGLCW